MTDTQQLLAKYVNDGSEAAFRELVARYFDLVYSTAVRLVDGDSHSAQDIAQTVFADLARSAGKLSPHTMLGGWLHRHTCFVARTFMRGERRRRAREKQAAEMNALNRKGVNALAHVAPILDEAINELGGDDREAILLRFFEQRNLRSVGEALGMTENAAQKRVARAIHELAILLQRRGATVSIAALASGLGAAAVTAAPPGLAACVAGAALAHLGNASVVGLTSAHVVVATKVKLGLAAALVGVAAITLVLLKHGPSGGASNGNGTPTQQAVQEQETEIVPSDNRIDRETAPPIPRNETPEPPPQTIAQLQPSALPAPSPPRPSAPVHQVPAQGANEFRTVRLYPKPAGRIRIEGSSTVHDWQVESRIIGGFLEVGRGIPLEPGATPRPGPANAQAEVFVPVKSLGSVDKTGAPYSLTMDSAMHASLRADRYPKIFYRLLEMAFIRATNQGKAMQFEYSSRGTLAIAGVTNKISMPITIVPKGPDTLQVFGRLATKMSSFGIQPPSVGTSGMVKSRDEIVITFTWVVAPRPASGNRSASTPPETQTISQQQASPIESAGDGDLPIQLTNADLSQVSAGNTLEPAPLLQEALHTRIILVETSQNLRPTEEALLDYFKQNGVPLKSPAYARYDEKTHALTVHATLDDLDKVDFLLGKLKYLR